MSMKYYPVLTSRDMITVFNIFAYLWDMGYLETLIIVIFPCQFTKGIWESCLFALRDMEY